MSYDLEFHPDALKEWRALDNSVRGQLKKKLAERLQEPHVAASRLSGHPQRYKIKLRSVGFRLVYEGNADLAAFPVRARMARHFSGA
jgi:mRNA interferase RelE/StbE